MTVQVQRGDRFAIFWGGGLGDILVLRPLLLALASRLQEPPYFFTTAAHLRGLFEELGLSVRLQVLPATPLDALKEFRRLGVRFDWIYLGPHPRLKTRLLARAVGAKRIWNMQHGDADAFIGEQVLADVRALGLETVGASAAPYGGGWDVPAAGHPRDYLVVHAGAKPRWETTRWPAGHWQDLLRRTLAESQLDLRLVGTEAERSGLERLVEGSQLPAAARDRIFLETALPLRGLAGLVAASRGVICHNSGVMHLSAMLRRPTVVVTGSSARSWRPPYQHVVNVTSGACELACNQYRCPVPFYRARCIRFLEVETVMGEVRKQLLDGQG